MRNKKAFTLVELLGIIIVMGLILTLLVPNITRIINNSKDKTFKESVKAVIRSAENYFAEEDFELSEGSCFDVNSGKISIKETEQIKTGDFCVIDGQPYLKHISDGERCASGGINDLKTYNCGEANVVIFDSTLIENNNKPYISLPFFATVVKKGDKLLNYIKDYEQTLSKDGLNYTTYNFWRHYNITTYPYKYDPLFNENTIITTDTIYRVSEININNKYANDIVNGEYLIRFANQENFVLGYPDNVVSSGNVIQANVEKTWVLEKFSNYFVLKTKPNITFWLDTFGGSQLENRFLTTYGKSDNLGTPQQRLVPVNEGNSVFTIRGYQNNDLCITPESSGFVNGNKLIWKKCDGSLQQKFYFEKIG